MFQAMFRAQCAWDAAMGWNALRALQAHGGENAIMVVLIGGGHVAYGLGAERQVRLWFDGKIASVLPIPIADEVNHAPIQKVQASYANFIWGLPPTTDPIYPVVGLSTPEQKSGERFKVILVAKESPAEAAGLAVGDELVSIDGVAIQDKETSNQLIAQKRWGDSVVYKVLRERHECAFTVELRRRPPALPAPANEGSVK
jgi:S1-C subfamily serine protease